MYKRLFGLKGAELTDTNWSEINEAIRQKSRDPSWYDHVVRDLCKLEVQVQVTPWFEDYWEDEYFAPILRMDPVLTLHQPKTREELEQYLDVSITGLKTAKHALQRLVERYVEMGLSESSSLMRMAGHFIRFLSLKAPLRGHSI